MWMRELRWLVLCDEYGVKTEPELQYRDGKFGYWEDIPTVEIKITKDKQERGEKK